MLEAIGLTSKAAFSIIMIRFVKGEVLHFEPLTPNVKTIQAIKEARLGKGKSFKTVDDLMADLNADH
jgi:DNA-damage-inducible protein J